MFGGSNLEKIGMPGAVEVHCFTDKGSIRSNNEDYFGYYIPPDSGLKERWGSLFAVADGVGGSAAGEVASAEAVNVLLQEYYFGDHTEKVPERLKNAFQHTALHIYDLSISHASNRNMKCTLTTLLLKQNRFFITHVGDSKILLLRGDDLIQLTKDHSLVGKLVRLGSDNPGRCPHPPQQEYPAEIHRRGSPAAARFLFGEREGGRSFLFDNRWYPGTCDERRTEIVSPGAWLIRCRSIRVNNRTQQAGRI